ncbi:MAG: site-specific integrase [Clostridia bacterium]|nr:site-specific integrase [Clostridia bacterium]
MAQRKLLTNGNAFRRTDDRWCGVVWYLDEQEQRKRKSFSGTTKAEVNKKITEYISNFDKEVLDTVVARKTLEEGLGEWLRVFKFPSVERATYDRCECSARNQIYPALGKKVIGNITAAMIKKLLNDLTAKNYAYTTVKGTYNLLNEYFRYLEQEELIEKNPMRNVQMLKKANFLSAQGKEFKPTCETVTVFTPEEIDKFKAEAFRVFSNGKRCYQQAAAYVLMLNTGLRTGETLGLRNSDIDLENRVMHINQAVKEVSKRDGTESVPGREVQIGKPKSATSKRDVPLNDAAVAMIQDLREEMYFGEDAPLITDENGDYTRPLNFRKRYYRILAAARIERKGLHSLRHTFATNLVNGIKQPDGSIKSLTPRQVADLLGHTTSEITELYYVKKDTTRLLGITNDFQL